MDCHNLFWAADGRGVSLAQPVPPAGVPLAQPASPPAGRRIWRRRQESGFPIGPRWPLPIPGTLRAFLTATRRGKTRFCAWEKQSERFAAFRGTLADSPDRLAACLEFDSEADRAGERLGTYAMLRAAEDQADSHCQRMVSRFTQVASRIAQAIELHSARKFWPCRRSEWTAFSTIRPWPRTGCG